MAGSGSVLGLDSRWLSTLLILLVAGERLVELGISRRNTERARSLGALEYGQDHYPWMVSLHGAFLVACPAEVWLLERPFVPLLAAACVALLALAMTLRYWAIVSLGGRWSTRVLCLPGSPALRRGPYRLLRHPNYAAVVVEILALPLFHSAWLTALCFSAANGWLLRRRIGVEEDALRRHCSYGEIFRETEP